MKKGIYLFYALLLFAAHLAAQTEKGKTELSLSGTFGSYTVTSEMSGIYHYSNSHTYTYALFAFRPGFFPADNFELEPEIMATLVKDSEPAFSFAGNLAYNFKREGSNIVPFILAGYGVCNSVPVMNVLLYRSSDKLDIGQLNLGAGAKIFAGQSVAIRAEYRFQHFISSRQEFSAEHSLTVDSHKLLIGISLFL